MTGFKSHRDRTNLLNSTKNFDERLSSLSGLEPAPAPDPGDFSPDSCQYVNEIFLSGEPDAGAGAGGAGRAGQLPVC